jgi:hypothetical protein
MSNIVMNSKIPGSSTRTVDSVNLYVNYLDLTHIPYSIVMKNAIGIPLYVQKFEGEIYYYGLKIAYILTPDANLTVPPYATVTSPIYNSFPAGADSEIRQALDAITHDPNPMVNVTLSITVLLGSYPADRLYYYQYNVPTNVSCTPKDLC